MPVVSRPDLRSAEPVIAGTGTTVAEFVATAHEQGLDIARARLAPVTPTDDDLEQVLTYCAERRCESEAAARCAGCQLRALADGIDSFEAFANQFSHIVLASGLRVDGGRGQASLEAQSLDSLARSWRGEEYWFWARRVLRKLRYGVRRRDELFAEAIADSDRRAPAIILMEPQIPENIGMVARAMANFGLDELRVVNPRDGWPNEKARAVASGAAAIVDGAPLYPTLDAAIGDLTWVCATTARQRDLRKPVLSPEQAAQEMLRRTAAGERCAILFGRERNGLETSEIAAADAIVMVPVNTRFASLNLAQSVLLVGYEWLKATGAASLGRVTTFERPLETGLDLGDDRRATKAEVDGFLRHLEDALEMHGFFRPDHRRPVVLRNLATMFTRAELTSQEVRTLRGIVATLVKPKGTSGGPPAGVS